MNQRRRLVVLSVNTLVLAFLLAGCAGDDDDSGVTTTGGTSGSGGGTGSGGTTGTGSGGTTAASCDVDVAPCGGDVVGTWTVTSTCPLKVSGAIASSAKGGLAPVCPDAPISEGSLAVTGTLDLKADGSFEDKTVTTGGLKFALGPACHELSGTQVDCAGIARVFKGSMGYSALTCTDSADGGCDCSATIDTAASGLAGAIGIVSSSLSTNGAYAAANNTITNTSDNMSYSYCVSGNTLSVSPQTATLGTGTTTGTVVFTKQ